ncbi:MAG: hypothetical protein KDD02_11475 [Phaeodactylibacter sp.]|nr:hypothetical protein [Phaeodactylibacter sp.]MCB9302161.1 hypothetical protein [Lewinellaceae bacterium]
MEGFLNWLYWYCTDFCIHAANLLGITYEEFNFILFLLIFPGVTIILLGINASKLLRRLKRPWVGGG